MNKNAVIIGANGGIGIEITKLFLENGITVYGTYNKDRSNIDKLASDFKKLNILKVTVEDRASISDLVAQIPKPVDIVVFSVTLPISYKPVFEKQEKDFLAFTENQTIGFFNIVKAFEKQIKSGQRIKFIIILTEACNGKPPNGLSDYISAKYSLMGFSKCMASELSRHGCTVNMISPGMTDTKLLSFMPSKLLEISAANNPLKRIGTPKDVAQTALFLASDSSDYLNGVNILVNGGGVIV